MKSAHVWFACSLLGSASVVTSCGDDDGKKTVRAGGAAGESSGGMPSAAEGGAGGDPQVQGGASGKAALAGGGGAPPDTVQGGAGAGGADSSVCFEPGAGGQAGATSGFGLSCDDLSAYFDSVNNQLVISAANLGPVTSASGSVDYWVAGTANCAQRAFELGDGQLELSLDPEAEIEQVTIKSFTVADACGNTLAVQPQAEFGCQHLIFYSLEDGQDNWQLVCEGQVGACTTACPEP
jgi:hypothetical protein